MCGIAGVFKTDGQPVRRETLEFMNRVQKHRGPDGNGIFCEGSIGLAHVRLAILDLTEAGHQPLSIDDRTITYNGEIYNFRELRTELQAKGHSFSSDCDTEVLLKSYLEWGQDCVKRFNGMFAFAIWTPAKQELFCARDRFGIKPFFYVRDQAGFEFASEIKALLHEPVRRKPRTRTLVRFFGEGLTDDEHETFFEKISILPPAHTLTVTPSSLKVQRYWQLDPTANWQGLHRSSGIESTPIASHSDRLAPTDYFPQNNGIEEASEAFRDLFADSVKLRLRSDVPVGTCLSGGLDSSSVVTCAHALIDRPMETFSSVYPDRGYDERRFIDDVVESCQTNPNFIEPDGADLPDVFDRIVWHQDEPTGGPGLYSQWKVMERAKSRVTVLLDGQGGDELLAGYHYYFPEYLAELAKDLLADKQSLDPVFEASQIITELTGRDHKPLAERAIRRAKRPKILGFFRRERPGKIKPPESLSPDFLRGFSKKDATRSKIDKLFSNSLSQRLYDDLTRFSIPALLRYEDRNSMAHSLEARVPFLDHRLIEFCLALPYQFKIDPPHTKLILRHAMNGRLPKSVTTRQDKLGYPTPASLWFRAHLKEWVTDTLNSQGFKNCELFNHLACLEIWKDHQTGADRSWELWRILHGYRWHCLLVKGQAFQDQQNVKETLL